MSDALGLAVSNYDKWGASNGGGGDSGQNPESLMMDQYPTMDALRYNLNSAVNQAKKAGAETYSGQANNAAARTLVQTQAQLAKAAAAGGGNNPYAHWRPKRTN